MSKKIAAMAAAAVLLLVGALPGEGGASGARASRGGSGFRVGSHVSRQAGVRAPAFRPRAHVPGQVRAGASFRHRTFHPGFRPGHAFRGHPGFHRHPRVRSRVFLGTSLFIGGPIWWGAPAWGPTYVAPPAIVYQTPSVYVPPAPAPAYWYYCAGSQTYYPYVQECPGGWTPVLPAPPAE